MKNGHRARGVLMMMAAESESEALTLLGDALQLSYSPSHAPRNQSVRLEFKFCI
jgi:hypothetical protein